MERAGKLLRLSVVVSLSALIIRAQGAAATPAADPAAGEAAPAPSATQAGEKTSTLATTAPETPATRIAQSNYCAACYSDCGPAGPACPDATSVPDDWITNVTYAGISNNSFGEGCPCSYGNYTGLSASVTPGDTNTLSVSFCSEGNWTECVSVWIDWDQSKTFDAAERYDLGCGVDATFSMNITTPNNAVPGSTVMRVMEEYSVYPAGPCPNTTYGEIEDYTVTVSGESDCCAEHPWPGCDDPACESSVCSYDPFCCDVEWSPICADEAQTDPNCNCGGVCGDGICDPGEDCSNCPTDCGPCPGACTIFYGKAEFEAFNAEHGKILKGIETFEESNLLPASVTSLNDPLCGGIPNVDAAGFGFPGGLDELNLCVQSNNLGGAAVVPSPTGLDGLANASAGFPGAVSDVVLANFFVDSLDLIFSGPPVPPDQEDNHTGVGFDTLSFLGGFNVQIQVFDKNNVMLVSASSPSDEAGNNFWGVWCPETIGRINIFDPGNGAEGGDNIQMWLGGEELCPKDKMIDIPTCDELPIKWIGNTTGAGNDSTCRPSEDLIITIDIFEHGYYTFDLCVNLPDPDLCWDSHIYLTAGDPCACEGVIAENDNHGSDCTICPMLSKVGPVSLAPGEYWIVIEGVGTQTDTGHVDLHITSECKPVGACCDHAQPGGVCIDNVPQAECTGVQQMYFPGMLCADVEAQGLCEEHTGACCDHSQPGGSCVDGVPESQCFAEGEVFFTLNYGEFQDFMLQGGKTLKGIETFEESNIPDGGKQPLPDPLRGNVPNVDPVTGFGFPNGLTEKNLIIQSNSFPGPNPPVPMPSPGNPFALYVLGPAPGAVNSKKVGEDLFNVNPPIVASLDLIFTEPNHTGVGFWLSSFGETSLGWHITVYDKNDLEIFKFDVLPEPPDPEPSKTFVGVWTPQTIGRINIWDHASPAPDAIDDIEMWIGGGGQLEWFKNLTCDEISCFEHAGACCDGYTGVCTDGVPESQCPTEDPQFRWEKGLLCSDLVPPCTEHTGACCDGTTGICEDDVPESECPTGGGSGGPVSVVTEMKAAPTCSDGSDPDVPEPLDVCNVYVHLEPPAWKLISAGFADITTDDPAGFYHHPSGMDTSPLCALIPNFPGLVCDSFVTVGLKCWDIPAGDATSLDCEFDSLAFNESGQVTGGWFNIDPPGTQGLPDADGNVLVAQLAVRAGHSIAGILKAYVHGPFGGSGDCPDLDGDGVVNASDLAQVLGACGQCGGSCPEDFNGDGVVDGVDLYYLLAHWGPCEATSDYGTFDVVFDCFGLGQYRWEKGVTCDEMEPPCVEHTGACCDGSTGVCQDNVPESQCPVDPNDPDNQYRWEKDTLCADLDPPCEEHTGACCDGTTGQCEDNVPESDCPVLCFGECIDGSYCDDPECCFDPANCPICYAPHTMVSIQLCGDCFGECIEGSYCDHPDPFCCVDPAHCQCYVPEHPISMKLCNLDPLPDNQYRWEKGMLCDDLDPACEEHTGACCDGTTGVCQDNVPESQCPVDPTDPENQYRWEKGTSCADLDPPCLEHTGACCDGTTGICLDEMPESGCPVGGAPDGIGVCGNEEECETPCPAAGACVTDADCGAGGQCLPDCVPSACGCEDNVWTCTEDCLGRCAAFSDQFRWEKDTLCADLEPPCTEHTGACCDGTTGNCENDVPESQCPVDCFGECIGASYCDDPECCVDPENCPVCYIPNSLVSIELCGDCFGECIEGSYCDNPDPMCCLEPDDCVCYMPNHPNSIRLCGDCFGECIDGGYCDPPDSECCILPDECRCYGPDHPVSVLICTQYPDPDSQNRWEKDTACVDLDPPCIEHTGACCDGATGVCIDDVPESECPVDPSDPNHRVRWGKGVLCADLEPPCEGAAGACCFDIDDGPLEYDACVETDEVSCLSEGGVFEGAGTVCTSEACCLPGGYCQDADPECCVASGGEPQGIDSVCTDLVPCCLPDGLCEMLDPLCCAQLGGGPSPTGATQCLGDGDDNGMDDACDFPQPIQACCLPEGDCVDLTHNACVAQGGDPQGPDVLCDIMVGECHPLKWAQPPTFNPFSPHPECFWGWDEFSVYGIPQQIVADDWLCEGPQPITNVHWWGSYMNWEGIDPPEAAPGFFQIGIWTDADDGGPFSHPGVMIHQWIVARAELNERAVACDFHPAYMADPDGCFRYDFVIPEGHWFYQEGAGNIYWLSISAMYAGLDCACSGDINGDGVINVFDVLAVTAQVGCTVGSGDPDCDAADVDCDGDVDAHDLGVVECQFGNWPPEPLCCGLPDENPWGWKTREHFYNDDAVRIFEPFDPVPGSPYMIGEPIEEPAGVSWDLAFVLTTSVKICWADLSGDGIVEAFDLALLLGAWGPCPSPCSPGNPAQTCPADLSGDCVVEAFDLAMLLGDWGPCD